MPYAMTTEAINAAILEAMRAQAVSQRQIAELLGINQSQVSARLRGQIDWRTRELDAVTARLGLTITIGAA